MNLQIKYLTIIRNHNYGSIIFRQNPSARKEKKKQTKEGIWTEIKTNAMVYKAVITHEVEQKKKTTKSAELVMLYIKNIPS